MAIHPDQQDQEAKIKENDLVKIRQFKLKVTNAGRFLILKAEPDRCPNTF
jgi:hypothetical protein